jgi:hypothetical protein
MYQMPARRRDGWKTRVPIWRAQVFLCPKVYSNEQLCFHAQTEHYYQNPIRLARLAVL